MGFHLDGDVQFHGLACKLVFVGRLIKCSGGWASNAANRWRGNRRGAIRDSVKNADRNWACFGMRHQPGLRGIDDAPLLPRRHRNRRPHPGWARALDLDKGQQIAPARQRCRSRHRACGKTFWRGCDSPLPSEKNAGWRGSRRRKSPVFENAATARGARRFFTRVCNGLGVVTLCHLRPSAPGFACRVPWRVPCRVQARGAVDLAARPARTVRPANARPAILDACRVWSDDRKQIVPASCSVMICVPAGGAGPITSTNSPPRLQRGRRARAQFGQPAPRALNLFMHFRHLAADRSVAARPMMPARSARRVLYAVFRISKHHQRGVDARKLGQPRAARGGLLGRQKKSFENKTDRWAAPPRPSAASTEDGPGNAIT